MKKGDVPPPVPERVANPRIRKDQATTITHKHGLITAELSSRNLSKKQVQTLTFLTCQRISVASSSTTWVPSTGRVISGRQRAWTSLLPKVKSSMSTSRHFSDNSGETTMRM